VLRDDQRPKFDVLGRKPEVLRGESGVLGHQSGAFGEQFIFAVGTSHTDILTYLARSVVDDRALRARHT
jgi:hypothetical protein